MMAQHVLALFGLFVGHVPLLCTVDPIPQRPAPALESVDKCGPLGVQVPHSIYPLARVLVASKLYRSCS